MGYTGYKEDFHVRSWFLSEFIDPNFYLDSMTVFLQKSHFSWHVGLRSPLNKLIIVADYEPQEPRMPQGNIEVCS